MTKQEKIKEVLGDLFINADINGWLKLGRYMPIDLSLQMSEVDFIDATGVFRPKTLQGIENNNGWIKIDNENNLPKDHCYLHVYPSHEGSEIFCFFNTQESKSVLFENHTHYQQIEKPKAPVY